MLVSVFPAIPASAEGKAEPLDVIYYEDGSYTVITIAEDFSSAPRSSARVMNTAGVKSGSKTFSHYSDGGVLAWAATLSASFQYNGTSATCTAASCSVSISNSAWYLISKSTSQSGNTATAEVSMGRKLLGVTVRTINCTITLSCDANGNLS